VARTLVNDRGESVAMTYWPAAREKGCRIRHPAQAVLTYRPAPCEPRPDLEDFLNRDPLEPRPVTVAAYRSAERQWAARHARSRWRTYDRRLHELMVEAIISADVAALARVLDMIQGGEAELVENRDRRHVRARHFNRMVELVSRPKTRKDRLKRLGARS
jgi:hypothetical protein